MGLYKSNCENEGAMLYLVKQKNGVKDMDFLHNLDFTGFLSLVVTGILVGLVGVLIHGSRNKKPGPDLL